MWSFKQHIPGQRTVSEMVAWASVSCVPYPCAGQQYAELILGKEEPDLNINISKMSRTDAIVAIYILVAFLMFIIPLPSWLLDIFMAFNKEYLASEGL